MGDPEELSFAAGKVWASGTERAFICVYFRLSCPWTVGLAKMATQKWPCSNKACLPVYRAVSAPGRQRSQKRTSTRPLVTHRVTVLD